MSDGEDSASSVEEAKQPNPKKSIVFYHGGKAQTIKFYLGTSNE